MDAFDSFTSEALSIATGVFTIVAFDVEIFVKTELDFSEWCHDPVVGSDHFCGGTSSDHDIRKRHLNYFG